MSAPNKRWAALRRRHWAPLTGMGGVLAAAAVLLAVFLGWLAWNAGSPQGAALLLDERTGTLVRN